MDTKEETKEIATTGQMDFKGDEVKNDSIVLYSDPKNNVSGEAGYIVKNLLGVWEVRNISEQTGTDLVKTSSLEVIGSTKK